MSCSFGSCSEMGLLRRGGRFGSFICGLLCLMVGLAAGNVVLIGNNVSLSFNDIEANFAPGIKGSGECGVLFLAEPLDACSPLTNRAVEGSGSPFALIIRGGCTFDDKVRNAQNAGFKAAIVYDNEENGALVAMAGTPGGIHIHAVFVSKASGEILKEYTGRTDVELWIIPTFENSAWSIMAISFITLLAMSAVLATCFFVRRHRIRREQPNPPNHREFHGMSSQLVKAMPSLIFTSVLEGNSTSGTCAICIEDYKVGDRIRILPCRHKFHAFCVDSWLTTWRSFCPVCKQDARTSTANPPATEYTPLLSSAAASPSSTAGLSSFHSFHSSIGASPPIQISPASQMQIPPRVPLASRTRSLAGSTGLPNPQRSYNNSPAISISRSSADLRNASYNRSHGSSHLVSPHSLGFPLSSPINSRFISPYIASSSNASPGFLAGSSSRQSYLRHCSESGASLSGLASAQSLPGC